ncbi:MAG: helix-turn-helix domain-containing protein [Planctomycetaceae bacterium]
MNHRTDLLAKMSHYEFSRYIGILGSTSAKSHAQALDGIRRFSKGHGLTVVDFAEQAALKTEPYVEAWPLAGFISFGSPTSVAIPSVCLLPNVGVKTAIDVNHSSIARTAFGHLRSLNPSSISLLREPGSSPSIVHGWNIAGETYSGHRGEFALMCKSPLLEESSQAEKDRFEQWLFNLPRPAAICCSTDVLAVATMTACRRLGLSSPEDVAVVTCENSTLADQFQHGISGVSGAFENAGYEAAQMLLRLIDDSSLQVEPIVVDGTSLTKRGSTDQLAALPEDVRTAQEFIQREACRGINVKDVMATQDVSRVTFERRFKEYTGQTPGAEIRRIRIEKAQSLLKTTDIPVSEVATRCGFEGSSRFSLFFRKRAGLSPTEFRARHRS